MQSPAVARFTGPGAGAKAGLDAAAGGLKGPLVSAAPSAKAAASAGASAGSASKGAASPGGASSGSASRGSASTGSATKSSATKSSASGGSGGRGGAKAAAKGKAEQAAGPKGKGGPAGAAASGPAPASAASDPAFQAVVKQASDVAAEQRTHAPAETKAAEAQAAAVEPQAAVMSKGQARQVDQMEEAPTPAFDGAKFKEALMKRIEEMAPKNLEEADEFSENNKLGGVKDEMSGKVDAEKAASQGPLEEKTKEAPSTSGIEAKPVSALPKPDIGAAPGPIGAERAAPKTQDPSAVEAPLADGSRSIDDEMAANNVTDAQLQKSNESSFKSASDAKSDAQTHAAEDPKGYRQFENKTLTKAEAEAASVAQKELQGMHADRAKGLTQVEGKQVSAKGKDEAARAKVAADIAAIYEGTKTKVEGILAALDGKVETVFDAGAAIAKKMFEDYVEQKMNAYKAERYSGLIGAGRWLKDKLLGMPDEVNRFYEDGRELYIQKMDVVIDIVITVIGKELAAARAEVQKGKDEIAAYVAKLPSDLKSVGQQAAAEAGEKFAQLEENIEGKQGELIDTLAQKYQENLQAVDEKIKEMKEANKGLVAKAIGMIKEVIETIKKLAKMLDTILKKIAEVVSLIISDPIGFFENLAAGFKKGFNQFVDNIQKHLIAGLFAWLTGAMGPVGITIPKDLFSLKGIFNLVMQVLGLTWAYIRSKAVQLFGETVVAVMEKGAEIFMKLREGPDAVWEYVKEQFNDLKEMVLDQIKEMIITEVIKAGIKWLIGLLNPAAAFIKAAMAIYSFVSFLFSRAAQILDFINGVLDGVLAIAKGQIDGAANLVEKALAKSIPLIIGMLAALLGISGLVTKVQKLIMKIRKRIDTAITKLLMKVKAMAGKLLSGAKGALLNWWKKRTTFKAGKENHSLYFQGEGSGAKLMVASNPMTVEEYVASVEGTATKDPKKSAIATIKAQAAIIRKLQALPQDQQNAKEAEFSAAFAAIGDQLKILLAGSDWGSKESPFPIEYPKRRASTYQPLYFAPKGSAATALTQSELKEKAKSDTTIQVYYPTGSKALPGGGKTIGIASSNQVQVGMVRKYEEGKTKGGGWFNKILGEYGYSATTENRDADHVVEMQIGGKNQEDNMWPLDASENRSSGSKLKAIRSELPDGGAMSLNDVYTKRSGKETWIVIVKTRDS